MATGKQLKNRAPEVWAQNQLADAAREVIASAVRHHSVEKKVTINGDCLDRLRHAIKLLEGAQT